MELDLSNNSTIATAVEKYQAAGISEKQAYALYQKFDALKPLAGEKTVSAFQKIKAITQQSYTPKQKIALVATLYTDSSKESLLPYITASDTLLSRYIQTQDTAYINMTVPYEFEEQKVEYKLTTQEIKLFRDTYVKYFNDRVTNMSTDKYVTETKAKAYDAAKLAVIRGRK